MVKFENVSKKFSDKISALTDISFEVESGEFIFFVGPSGAGKSTLLSLINLQMLPSTGTITFDEFDYSRIKKKEVPKIRRKIGFIYQDYKLLLDHTVGENVSLPLEIIGAKSQIIKEAVTGALAQVGLPDKERLFPRELSGGEVQRVAIARAIITNPKILLADEPTADLDDKNAWTIVRLLEKINKDSGTTIMMATHNAGIVKGMNKHVITLEDGHVVSDTRKPNQKQTEQSEANIASIAEAQPEAVPVANEEVKL